MDSFDELPSFARERDLSMQDSRFAATAETVATETVAAAKVAREKQIDSENCLSRQDLEKIVDAIFENTVLKRRS